MYREYVVILLALCLFTTTARADELLLHDQSLTVSGKSWTVSIPDGMHLELLTDRLEQPRLMTFLPNGELLIGSRAGKVYRLQPPYTSAEVLVNLDDYPHSLAYRDGELLIAQTDGLYRAVFRPGQARIDPNDVDLLAALPGGGGHNSRTVAIGPDQRVYLALGISGNCSDEYLDQSYRFDHRRGGVLVLDESGPQPRWQSYASGLRNPVGFDWQPQTHILYASNNGPDHLGYDQPPEYFAKLALLHSMACHGTSLTGRRSDGITVYASRHPDHKATCRYRLPPSRLAMPPWALPLFRTQPWIRAFTIMPLWH
jgi:glucose/arabinose dehydrogenase